MRDIDIDDVVGEIRILFFLREFEYSLPPNFANDLNCTFGGDPYGVIFTVLRMLFKFFPAFVVDDDMSVFFKIRSGIHQGVHEVWKAIFHQRASIHDHIVEVV